MTDRELPTGAEPERRTPDFTAQTVPAGLLGDHRTAVWARLEVERGSVEFVEQATGWQAVASPGEPVVIVPDRLHHIIPSSDALFAVQFYRLPR